MSRASVSTAGYTKFLKKNINVNICKRFVIGALIYCDQRTEQKMQKALRIIRRKELWKILEDIIYTPQEK